MSNLKTIPPASNGIDKKSHLFGYGSIKPKYLQHILNNPKAFLGLLTLANIVLGITTNGLLKVNVTTIERRFHLLSSESGLIISAYDIAGCIALLPVSYLGGRGHKPRWIGIGLLVDSMGMIMLALPHFIARPYVYASSVDMVKNLSSIDQPSLNNTTNDDVCVTETVIKKDSHLSLNNLKYVFIFGQFLIGAGSTPLTTLSLTFLDDSVNPDVYPAYIGIYYMGALIGPSLGFIIGGRLLEVFTDLNVTPNDISVNSPLWVGAWWVGFVICAIAMLVVSIPVLGYPKQLPSSLIRRQTLSELSKVDLASKLDFKKSAFNHETSSFIIQTSTVHDNEKNMTMSQVPTNSIQQIYKNVVAEEPSPGTTDNLTSHLALEIVQNFFKDLWLVITNKPFVALSLAAAVLGTLVSGFSTFGPKFIESQLHKSPSEAANLFGYVFIPAGTIGLVSGSVIMTGFKLLHKKALLLCLAISIVSLIAHLTSALYCDDITIAGVNIPYTNQTTIGSPPKSLENFCNENSSCQSRSFDPVCGSDGVTYYSSCFASCQLRVINDSTSFSDCLCIPTSTNNYPFIEKNLSTFKGGNATIGSCTHACKWQSILLAALFFVGVTTFICAIPGADLSLRCFPPKLRSLSVGVQWIVIRTIGFIPGPILFGSMIDSTCLLWNNFNPCSSSRGSCILYKNQELSISILILSLIFKGLSVVFFAIALQTYQPASEDIKIDGSGEENLFTNPLKGKDQQHSVTGKSSNFTNNKTTLPINFECNEQKS